MIIRKLSLCSTYTRVMSTTQEPTVFREPTQGDKCQSVQNYDSYMNDCLLYVTEHDLKCNGMDAIECAQRHHFKSLIEDSDFEFADLLDVWISGPITDCYDRDEDDDEYMSCCHKMYCIHLYEPTYNEYNPMVFTIHSTLQDLTHNGRV